jgi:PKD repeat protein
LDSFIGNLRHISLFNPFHLKKRLLFITILFSQISFSQTWETNKAKLQSDGCLSYEADVNLNRIPDFSNAGYGGGGVAIPNILVAKTISPVNGDNTSHIQAAIDEVSDLTPDSNGFRGAILLNPGTYPVSGQLFIHTSGVVLRGSGDGRDIPNPTIIYGTGNVPAQRDLIIMGGNDNNKWETDVPGTRQDIVSNFVQVGSRQFEVADASPYSIGDNIIIYHPCSIPWLEAIDYGGTGDDPGWREDQYPILYNRFITDIQGNEITIDAPVFNHLDRSLSQSYIYTYDRKDLVTNVGIENLRIDIESLGGDDEDHIWNGINIYFAEDAWVRNLTVSGFGLSGVQVSTSTRVSVVNVHSVDPVAEVTGGRMYNFHISKWSNNILIDNCYARGGRHHYITNGTGTISGIVVLRSKSENPYAASEGHRQWSTGILFDNLIDFGTYPSNERVLGFYNRGSGGTAHGWASAHSVMWNCNTTRPGKDAGISLEQPPTAQNYAIGCKGKVGLPGSSGHPLGYIEGSNREEELVPASLYEAQLLCRTSSVISDFKATSPNLAPGQTTIFSSKAQGNILTYQWDFGEDAIPNTASGPGPHSVSYSTTGVKTASLTVSNGLNEHTEIKTAYIKVDSQQLFAVNDYETLLEDDSVISFFILNDFYPQEVVNFALSFDGIDDNVIYEAEPILDEYPFTMMAWIKTDSDSAQTMLYLGKQSSNFTGNSISMENGMVQLEAWSYDGSSIKKNINSTIPINDGQWHHVAGVYESSVSRYLFIDGQLAGSDTSELNNIGENLYRISVGNRQDRIPNGWFNGEIDEVRFYAAALSQNDLLNLMTGKDCSDNEKLLYWNFNDTTGHDIQDQFHYFDGNNYGATFALSELELSPLSAIISEHPKHGTAYFLNDFEIKYLPETGYFGLDSLQYVLKQGECDSSSAWIQFFVDEVVGLQVISYEELHLFPNPSSGRLFLSTENEINRIEIFSADGKFIRKSFPNGLQLDISDLNQGLYVFKFWTSKGKLIIKKILVQ